MKTLKYILFFIAITSFLGACKKDISKQKTETSYQCPMKCEGEKIYADEGSCPICKMDLQPIEEEVKNFSLEEITETSIFNLTSKWNTEEGEEITLKKLKGKTLVMVMIYTTCKAACPRLVADMRNIEVKIPAEFKNEVQYIMVSIDPKNDTPKRLKEFAIENLMDDEKWTFLQGTEDGVREFANVLAVKYKKISPLDFSHSNIISVFNPQGDLVHQQEGLGVDNKITIEKIIETVKK
ncbi:SCO family protein [Polaribacter gangjinensis]|uniref:SCO family protein n=2 Tax=Polaribacter gangjinensis TaxID=574710 RepID=A0A2S7W9W8_9FLAO|nr:SCO family protein [Polaribacter gangjinensis]PQJ74387.1 SCO family protein [Polaribacter gangjinensis]